MTRRIVALLALAGLAAPLASDFVVYEIPERLLPRLDARIADSFRRHGLVAGFDFDGLEVRDRVGGYRGVSHGAVLAPGRFGRGRSFGERRPGYLLTDLPWSRLGTSYTISFWAKIPAGAPEQAIAFTRRGGGDGIMLSNGRMLLAVPPFGVQAVAYPFTRFGEWVHVAGVVDSGAGRAALYEDGVLKGRCALRAVSHPPGETVALGKLTPLRVLAPLRATLDEASFWERPLSEGEVRRLARARTPLGSRRFRLAAGASVLRLGLGGFAAAAEGLLKIADYFNPFLGVRRRPPAGLPSLNLVLSRDDLRALNAARDEAVRSGWHDRAELETRRVRVERDGRLLEARLRPHLPDPDSWRAPKPSFVLEAASALPVLGANRLLCVPPESLGLLREPLARELARGLGLPAPRGEYTAVAVSGIRLGLLWCEEFDGVAAGRRGADFPGSVARLPAAPADVLRDYDALRSRFEPLLRRDRRSIASSRRIRHLLERDRETLAAALAAAGAADRGRAQAAAEALTEEAVLGGNVSAAYVTADLALGAPRFPGVRISWASALPELVGADGAVRRPADGLPREVELEAAVTAGGATASKRLRFRVIPRSQSLPVLAVTVPEEVQNDARVPCAVRHRSEGRGAAAAFPGAIKLRGNTSLLRPKKSYSLRLEDAGALFPGSSSKVVYLMSSWADETYMHDRLAYDLFRSLSEGAAPRFAVRARHVVLLLNGEFQGVYQISERVDRHLFGFPGFRAKDKDHAVVYKAQDRGAAIGSGVRTAYLQIEPDPREAAYWGPFDALHRFVRDSGSGAFGRDVGRHIDVGCFTDFHILVNLSLNREGMDWNFFLARGPGEGRPFTIVPWDYDKSFRGPTDGWLSTRLFRRLTREVPGYREAYARRWRELRSRQLSSAVLAARIDAYESEIRGSMPAEFERWPQEAGHEEAVRELRGWIDARLAALDRRIERYATERPDGPRPRRPGRPGRPGGPGRKSP